MKKRIRNLSALSAATLLCHSASAAVIFSDDFAGGVDPSWITDRYVPTSVTTVMFGGDERLQMTVDGSGSAANRPGSYSAAFYNTQGIKSPDAATTGEPWVYSVGIYFSSAMLSGTGLYNVSAWANSGSGTAFPVLGFRSHDIADPFNPSAANITTALRVWDPEAGGYVEFAPTLLLADQWNTFEIAADAGGFTFSVNGSELYADNTVPNPLVLNEVFVQTYNYGQAAPTSYLFDNVSVTTVPEPTSALLGCIGLIGIMRRRRIH